MAIHSRILAWEIPWTEQPGGLQSTGHKDSDMTEHTHTHTQLYTGAIISHAVYNALGTPSSLSRHCDYHPFYKCGCRFREDK